MIADDEGEPISIIPCRYANGGFALMLEKAITLDPREVSGASLGKAVTAALAEAE